jgi:hypothetical protein
MRASRTRNSKISSDIQTIEIALNGHDICAMEKMRAGSWADLAKMVERTKDRLPMIPFEGSPCQMLDKPKPYGHHPFCYTTPTKVA